MWRKAASGPLDNRILTAPPCRKSRLRSSYQPSAHHPVTGQGWVVDADAKRRSRVMVTDQPERGNGEQKNQEQDERECGRSRPRSEARPARSVLGVAARQASRIDRGDKRGSGDDTGREGIPAAGE